MPTSQEVKQPAVDARSLVARPGPSLVRKIRLDSPVEKIYPTERSRFLSRNLEGGDGIQSDPLEDMSPFQPRYSRKENGLSQRPLQEESARYNSTREAKAGGRPSRTRFYSGNETSFQPPTDERRRQRLGGSRTNRSRAPRDSDKTGTRQRRRGAQDGSDIRKRNRPKEVKWTAEEEQYLKEKTGRESAKFLEYEPLELHKETFTGMAPATASDEWGMSEMLGERLLLARKYLDQEFIQWDSREQKADVMAVVEKLKAVRQGGKAKGDGEKAKGPSSVSGSGNQRAQALMQKLFAGEYAKFKRPTQNDVLGHVERHVHRNDSFYPDDEKSLLEKVRSILPAEQASSVGTGRRKEVEA